jgi:2-dehydro-3-deoxyphosphooctonate aldolase (KDO 8-P synthase)
MTLNLDPAKLFVIAGPCVIESTDLCMQIGEHMKTVCERLGITYVFKASFDKANRSSNASFRGPGITDGLVVLEKVKRELGLPVLTDIHEPDQAAIAAKVVDVLQVPAFLARQTDLLHACGATGKWVNVKKGQFMAPQEMENAKAKVSAASPEAKVMMTERGTFFGYNRLVNDFTALPVMKGFGVPVVFDITHSTQQPAGLGTTSGGNPKYSPMLARAAVAAGVDGLFLECHPEPMLAKSDPATMLALGSVENLLRSCLQIHALRSHW